MALSAYLQTSYRDLADVFCEKKSDVNVRVTDINSSTIKCRLCTTSTGLQSALDEEPGVGPSARLIIVYSKSTIHPLGITVEMFDILSKNLALKQDLVRIALSFGEEPHIAEASSSQVSVQESANGTVDIAYKLNYVEANLRTGQHANPWSFRHTGIYHRHEASRNSYLLLCPNSEGALQAMFSRAEGVTELSQSCIENRLLHAPFSIHALALSTYVDNWRWYMRDLGEKFDLENNKAMTIDPVKAFPNESFNTIKELRHIKDNTHFARACCKSNQDIVQHLLAVPEAGLQAIGALRSPQSLLQGYVESSDAFLDRLSNTIELVGYTLGLHNQLETANVDRELRDLIDEMRKSTESTANDGLTVKIVTIVSAVYLPGSFVATIYGMNFFDYDAAMNRIIVATDFWIFIATWLPLTGLTALLYYLVLRLSRPKKA